MKYLLRYSDFFGNKDSFFIDDKNEIINNIKKIKNVFGIIFGSEEVIFNNGNDLLSMIKIDELTDEEYKTLIKFTGTPNIKLSCFYEQLAIIMKQNKE